MGDGHDMPCFLAFGNAMHHHLKKATAVPAHVRRGAAA